MVKNPLRRPFKYSYFNASLILIAANCFVFAITSFFPNLQFYLGMCPAFVIYKKMFWQPFTYMFVHGSLMHLLSNMIGLLFFGISVEKAIGSKEFILLYLICGFLSGLCSLGYYTLTRSYMSILVGASGALYAILFAFAVIFPRAHIFVWGILPIPSPLLVLIYAGIELFSQFYRTNSNVAHFTHLFGFATAFVYFLVRMGVNPIKAWKDAYR
ncbi:MAG: rhomboid family intramembrane serine protease [Treponemataceae bacterium]|nr:rhomboid family intramembrane serine protease [Treponemataceae bacterium]